MSTGRRRKTLIELTLKENFMFAAVMMDERNAKGVLERALGRKVAHVKIDYEKSIVYNPEYKGVRLDVHIEDEQGTHFTVEMQVASKKIKKRARYYHDQVDMELLLSGEEYETMPDSYVIFICDFDPLGLGKYKYTLRKTLKEAPDYDYEDGSHTIFLSTKGHNDDEVSKDLVTFLHFAGASLSESKADYHDDFIERLQKSVDQIKHDREMGRRYMLLEEMMKDEFKAGKAEGRAEGEALGRNAGFTEGLATSICAVLGTKALLPDPLKERISSIRDKDMLSRLLDEAVQAVSIEGFEAKLDEMNL